MPEPSCCRRPAEPPGPPPDKPRHAEGRREPPDLILVILEDNRNGTLLDVLGIDPPYKKRNYITLVIFLYNLN